MIYNPNHLEYKPIFTQKELIILEGVLDYYEKVDPQKSKEFIIKSFQKMKTIAKELH